MILVSREFREESGPDSLIDFTSDMAARNDSDEQPGWLKDLQETDTTLKVEHPGAPFEDEMFGNLVLGKAYPNLNTRLQELDQLDKPEETFKERQIISNQISQLIVEATNKNAWHYGPVNIRKPQPQPQDLPHVPPFVEKSDEPKWWEGLEDDEMLPPIINEEEIPLPPRRPEEKGNWLTKRARRAVKWLKGEVKDFSEYTNRHRGESKLLAVLGGITGAESAALGVAAAQLALGAAFPPLLAGAAGIAVGLSINHGLMNIFNELYIKPRTEKALAKNVGEVERQDYLNKVELDRKGRVRAFAIADIVGKIAGTLGLGGIFTNQIDNQSLVHDGGNPAASYQAHGDRANLLHNVPQPDTATPDLPKTPFAPEDLTTNAATSEALVQPFTEHVVSGNSEMLTKIMESSLPTGENVYSDNYIKVLEMNRDTFVQMWKEMYPSGNIPYLVDSTTNNVAHLTLNQAVDNLDKVIASGYPDPAQLTGAEYRQALTDMFNAVRHLKPGTVIKIPTA